MTVRLHIDRIVIDPALGGDPRAIERDLVDALHTALAINTRWQSASEPHARIDAGAGASLGARVGDAIHAAVTRAGSPERSPR